MQDTKSASASFISNFINVSNKCLVSTLAISSSKFILKVLNETIFIFFLLKYSKIVLFTDFGTDSQGEFIYREAYRNPDPEHRLFFVGITRAKNKLFIMAPKTDYYYTIGDPII